MSSGDAGGGLAGWPGACLCFAGEGGEPLEIGAQGHEIGYDDAEEQRMPAERVPSLCVCAYSVVRGQRLHLRDMERDEGRGGREGEGGRRLGS